MSQIFFQIIFIAFVAYFNLSESAFSSLSVRKIPDDHKLIKHLEKPTKFTQMTTLGSTVFSFIAIIYGVTKFTPKISELLKTGYTISLVIVVIIITYFTVLFGQIIPKKLGAKYSLGFSQASFKVNNLLIILFTPLTFIVNIVAKLFLVPFKLDPNADEEVSEDDIMDLIEASGESGSIEEDEQEMIENIFDFNDLAVSEIMTRGNDVIAIDVKESAENIFKLIKKEGKSRYPVYDGDINNIIGILNARDFLINIHEGKKDFTKYLRKAYFVPESIKADQLFSDMQKNKLHIAIVIDEYGEMSGIVTLEDLLEEIVGNIYDEFDEAEELEIEKLEDNRWKINGSLSIEELEEELDIKLEESQDYDTVGGMIFSCLHTIPEDGDEFHIEIDKLKFTVTKVLDKRIVETIVEKLEDDE